MFVRLTVRSPSRYRRHAQLYLISIGQCPEQLLPGFIRPLQRTREYLVSVIKRQRHERNAVPVFIDFVDGDAHREQRSNRGGGGEGRTTREGNVRGSGDRSPAPKRSLCTACAPRGGQRRRHGAIRERVIQGSNPHVSASFGVAPPCSSPFYPTQSYFLSAPWIDPKHSFLKLLRATPLFLPLVAVSYLEDARILPKPSCPAWYSTAVMVIRSTIPTNSFPEPTGICVVSMRQGPLGLLIKS